MSLNQKIIVHDIKLCDEVSLGQFGKVNLLGVIPGDEISISNIPYKLESFLVFQGFIPPNVPLADLAFSVEQIDTNGSVLFREEVALCSVKSEDSSIGKSLFLTQPFNWEINAYGIVKFSLLFDGCIQTSKEYRILRGDSPYSLQTGALPSSGILQGSSGFSIAAILGKANRSLILMDQYIESNVLLEFLSHVPHGTGVQLLTSQRLAKNFRSNFSRISRLPQSVEVRFSRSFHCRFVIVNESEFFHFGHSLKDISKGRISGYHKLYRKDEITELWNQFLAEWKVASTL